MLIPDNLTQFDSAGERLLYNKFKNDISASGYYILHSLFTNHHLKSVSGEADFLVLAPGEGIFVLEVKHGRVKREGGYWEYTNRFGRVTRSPKGPFRQVSDTMHSIRDYIINRLSKNPSLQQRFSRILFGNGVVFTGLEEMPDIGSEGFDWQVLTRKMLPKPIAGYIRQLSQGWHQHNLGQTWYDSQEVRPAENDCLKLLELLRGDFDVNYALLNKTIDTENLIENFTREQFGVLDFVTYNDRALITGDAGTGKTLMALELMSRALRNGKRVCLLCFNQKLGRNLHEKVALLAESSGTEYYAGSLHSLMLRSTGMEVPAEAGPEFFNEELPFEFLLRREGETAPIKYDALIVDEFQDLTNPYYKDIFDTLLENGLKNGEWVFFADFCKQAIYMDNAEQVVDSLHQTAGFVKFPPLQINCRNTRKIARQNTLMSGARLPELRAGALEGDGVETLFPARKKINGEISRILGELTAEGIPAKKITILSPRKYDHHDFTDAPAIGKHISSHVNAFSTIHAFKGLENAIIIIAGFDELISEASQRLLYVAISRACTKLYIILDHHLQQEYHRLIQSNHNQILS